jgi:hypothetical protein
MVDLFGDTNTQPQCAGLNKRLLNAAHGFNEFWQAYPSGPRKVAKKQCLDRWARLECAESASHILAHVEWMKTQPDWVKDGGAFVCAPMVYLNQQRWLDWTPEPERPKKPDALAEIKAHKGAPMPENIRARIQQIKQGTA